MNIDSQLLNEAERLRQVFYDQAEMIEQSRRVPEELSRMMAEAGFYRMGVPEALGGLEVAPAVSSQVFETLARGDASCGWVAFIGTTSGTSLSGIPEAAGREVFSNENTMITGVFAPTAKAEKVDGGFNVSGRWQWGSGSQNADWVLGGCMLIENGEPMLDKRGNPMSTMMLMPASELEFIDTWHVSGLRGSGSLDYKVENLFVPDERAVGFLRERPAPGRLFKFPNFTFLALGIAAVSLGVARASIDEFVQLAQTKVRRGSTKGIISHPYTQMKVAEAEAQLRSARAFYYEAIEAVWQATAQAQPVPVELRRDLRLSTTHAVNTSVQVADSMCNLGGGTSVYNNCRLQRQLRDVQVARQHVMVAPSTLETTGRLYLGVDSQSAIL